MLLLDAQTLSNIRALLDPKIKDLRALVGRLDGVLIESFTEEDFNTREIFRDIFLGYLHADN